MLPTIDPSVPPVSALEAIFSRRSTRSYTADQPTRRTLQTLIAAAVQAPTALHLEPWSFVVVQDRAALKQVSDVARSLWSAMEPAGTAEPVQTPARWAGTMADPSFSIFHDAGTLVVICARPWGRFASADCWLAAGNLMLAACAMGLGTCCVGAAVQALNTPEVKDALGIPYDVTAVAPIVVGTPRRDDFPSKPRRPPEILVWR